MKIDLDIGYLFNVATRHCLALNCQLLAGSLALSKILDTCITAEAIHLRGLVQLLYRSILASVQTNTNLGLWRIRFLYILHRRFFRTCHLPLFYAFSEWLISP